MRASEWFGALHERNFRLFFIGRATSQLGSGMSPLAIAFAVLQPHGTATDLGIVTAAGAAPLVVFLLVGGVFADRLSRRLLMLGSDVIRTFAQMGLGVWILVGHPPLAAFIVLAAVMGTCTAFFSPALTGIVPQVISKGKLQQANALNNLSGSVAGIAGPVIAGVIVAASSAGWAVLIDGLTYAASVVSLFLIAVEWLPKESGESFVHQLRVGWREFWARTWLWVIVLEFSLVNVLIFAPMLVLGPVIAKQSLGGASAWALILAAEGAGAVLGGLVMLRWDPKRPLLTATLVTFAWVWPLLGLAERAPAGVIAPGAFLSGIGIALFETLWTTTMQREIPSDVLSRVSAYDWFGSLVFFPIGMAIVGPISAAYGITHTIVGAAIAVVALVTATLVVPSVRQLRAPRREVAPATG